jgi:CDP-glucose 4,6-dehydratase
MASNTFTEYKPEFVFHMAAQPLVKMSYEKPIETYETNVIGTINVLEAIRHSKSTKVGIMITSDKCYENKEQIWGYKENDNLGGYDPYSSSKGAAEIAINSWRSSFMNPNNYCDHNKAISSVRAGNVIGGGDWSKDRLVPDCIKSLEKKIPIRIRNPHAIRPWQHVLEPLNGYLLLGEKMYSNPKYYSEAWNFGPELNSIINVWDIASKIIDTYGKGKLIDTSESKDFHESKLLLLDISKSVLKLGWKPKLNIEETINYTISWYRNYRNKNVYDICLNQIKKYNSIGG